MVERCKNGHEFTTSNRKLPSYGCQACRRAAGRRFAAKRRATTGKWWKAYSNHTMTDPQIRKIASEVGRGKLLWNVTAGVHIHVYLAWVDWKHTHRAAAAAIKRQSALNRWAQRRERLQALVAAPALVPPKDIPENLWQMIAAVIGAAGELDQEIRQRLALAVIEGRCRCDAESLRRHAVSMRSEYFREYANPWGHASIDATVSDGRGDTFQRQFSRGLWDDH